MPNGAADTAGTDGDVLAVDSVGNRVWFGGRFSKVGELVHSGVLVNEDDGGRTLKLARTRYGTVRTSARDLKGGWYVGGDFTEVSSFARRGAARILSTGVVSAWNPDVNGTVTAIAYAGGAVYLGGTFTSVGGQPRQNLAAVAWDTGAVLPWDPGADGPVDALAVTGPTLYVGGSFSAVGGQPRSNLAAVAADSGAVAAWAPGTDGPVREITASSTTLFVGGAFATVGGRSRPGAAAVDTAGTVLAWNPGVTGIVETISVRADRTSVFLGGSFTAAGGAPRANLAEVNASGGTATAWNPGSDGVVHDMDLSRWRSSTDLADSVLFVGGEFTQAAGTARHRTAGIDTATGAARPWNPSADGPVHTVTRSGTAVYVGGGFEWINSAPRARVAAMDAATGRMDHDFVADLDGEVKAVGASADGAVLYVGGAFTAANGQPRRNAAAFDGWTGALLPWNPSPDAPVRALDVSTTHVFLGGGFTNVGGRTRPSLAAVKRSDGLAEVAFNAGASGVDAVKLSIDETKLYVAGSFNRMGGQPRPQVAEVWASSGVATSFAPTTGGAMVTLAVAPSGGRFWTSTHSNRLYAYDPAVSNVPVWSLQTSGDIQAMAASDTELYLGGHFSSIKGQGSRLHAASVRTADGVITPWNPVVAGIYGPWAATITPAGVVMGGDFEKTGNAWHPRLAVFRGTA